MLVHSEGVRTAKMWPQWLAAVEVSLLSILVGLVSGWTSPYLAKLTRSETEGLVVTAEEASWIAAILSFGRIGGAVAGALMVDYCGTKVAVLCTGIPHALGWLLFLVPSSIWFIHVSRILGGFGIGMYFSTFPLYMGEISSPKIRGALISLITQGMPLGVLLGNVVGAYTPIWIFSCISLVPNVAFLMLFAALPDSPHYLILRDRDEEAKKSLEWYNRGVDVAPELQSLREFIHHRKSTGASGRQKIGKLLSPDNRRALILVSIVFIFIQLSGLWTTSFYMEIILSKAGVTVVDPSLVVIVVGLLGIVFGWASMYANDKCGRKIMLASSCLGITLSYLLLGLDYQLLGMNYHSDILNQCLPIIAVVTFQCSLCIGVTPVPATLMSEMFSPDVKSTATCIVNLCSSIFAFIVSKTYQTMIDLTSEQYVFWLYGSLNFCLVVYTLIYIPETKGKSLVEIQEIMRSKNKERLRGTKKNQTDK
ncbi:facilitated trehalose transporter Tret1-like [Venturia canescens]|uniref:facilitated trehalose transporter Tret1-like n=1 Tax=Venturia canescens TaxID=32260 RepID=UPI001C9CA86C|nr:facilitated trehalose transporter Tret1-like [Venturia canescens]